MVGGKEFDKEAKYDDAKGTTVQEGVKQASAKLRSLVQLHRAKVELQEVNCRPIRTLYKRLSESYAHSIEVPIVHNFRASKPVWDPRKGQGKLGSK